ncbi:Hsp70 family protein [Glycomyces luteolus]|uniref:Hsp70 family protein n=1 Tax=Glycomyces luteolus TaxID=2670330 RepID=A0A9X3PCU2_9ACTN|nr:Hsp70 family protein [Glycomyces luteolus]MDA1362853.1 Hsp70 family protein [Glycomyces luteolus]
MQTPVWLAVDLGTTHTVAVVGREGQEPRSLLFDGSPLLPSGVYLDAEGELHTGRDAQRLAAADPARFEPHPKRRIDDSAVLLGDREVPVEELLATGLRRVAEAAAASGQKPTQTVLTYPADWGPVRRAVLERAAVLAGFGRVRLLAEPIAAATYCAEILGREIPRGGAVAIFDFGGGTFDVAVVRREDDDSGRFRTLAVGGLDDLGGLDVDMALAAHLGRIVAGRDPELWQRLSEPETTADLRDRLAFWGEVRAAKEMLSRTSTAPVALPGHNPMGLHLTRDELQSLADPFVSRAVDETRRTVERAGVAPAELAALLLVGGSSRMPLVATRLHARLGVAPAVPEQPELPVAFGALRFAVTDRGDPAGSTPPRTPPAGEPGVLNYAPYPVVGVPSPPPTPVGGHPSPAPPPTPAGTLPPRADFTPQAPLHLNLRDRPSPPPQIRRFLMGVVASTLVIVIGIVFALTRVEWPDFSDGLQVGDLVGDSGPDLVSVYEQQLGGAGTGAVVAAADMAVFAEVTAGRTTAYAVGSDGTALWTNEYELEPETIHLMVVGDLLILDAMYSATDEGRTMRAAALLSTGEFLWKQPWEYRTDVAFYGTEVIVEQRDGFDDNAAIRIDLATGEEVWRKKGPESLYTIDDYRISAASVWNEGEGAGALPPNSYSLFDNLTVTEQIVDLDPEAGTAVVRDASTGEQKGSGTLPIDDDHWTVYGGFVIARASEEASPGRDTLVAYSLDDFIAAGSAEPADIDPAWSVELEVSYAIEEVKACGPQLVCAALDHTDGQDKTVAYDTATGEQVWEVVVDWADEEHWYTSPDGLVFGDQTFDTVDTARVLDFDGGETVEGELFVSALAVQGGRAVMDGSYIGGWEVSVVDMATGKASAGADIGADLAEHASLSGDLLAVLTGDNRALVFSIPALT